MSKFPRLILRLLSPSRAVAILGAGTLGAGTLGAGTLGAATVGAATVAGCSAGGTTDTRDPNASNSGNQIGTDEMGNSVVEGNVPIGGGGDQNIIPVSLDEDLTEGVCANGSLNSGEACDDGNAADGDGCSADCLRVEDGFACAADGNCVRIHICGDSIIAPFETCDDGNAVGMDGCSETCQTETDFACPNPGEACVSSVECGDSAVGGTEECDDANVDSGDGCTDSCTLEPGWACPVPGAPCSAVCGDGVIVGLEDCDDGNTTGGDGCSATCTGELGWVCDTPGAACREAVCGDGKAEGGEPCDDGENTALGDGCSPGCRLEPDCSTGACASRCGDGLILPADNEQCDDGNTKAGDGCSPDCQIEAGFECEIVNTNLASTLTLPIVYRDFIGIGFPEGEPAQYQPLGYHEDFENEQYSLNAGTLAESGGLESPGIVAVALGADGRPAYAGTTAAAQDMTSSEANFDEWFHDTAGVNKTLMGLIDLRQQADESYVFDSSDFFPIDNFGWVDSGEEPERVKDWRYQGCWDPIIQEHVCGCADQFDCDTGAGSPPAACADSHNYSFTSEVRYWFEYQGGEELVFRGDDDVFVYIKGQLVVDLGGLHEPLGGDVCGNVWGTVEVNGTLIEADQPACAGLSATTTDTAGNNLDLQVGQVYEAAVFQAERHTCQSNYRLTLGGFTQNTTQCASICGDGVVAGDEACDDGEMNGAGYGFCAADCSPGPRCGDGKVEPELEECDNGTNLDGYFAQDGDCAVGCVFPPYCGDGQVDAAFGETCDDGVLDNSYNGCDAACQLGPRCGDNITQEEAGEQCDDGNRRNGDECNVQCQVERVIMK